ncbi:hypothetical protein [uncultured Azohydromonas sp.]|uniref:hypothetical protein n=1 Tax=uncultured Azohydromonas sp. TaxID=487342 RepID=UPI002629F7A5|nr:hypothetical protein [uncultured Azohydromonas sp.]
MLSPAPPPAPPLPAGEAASAETPPGHALPAPLQTALRQAPRRYRMPPLPADAGVARSAGAETALAFALEVARGAAEHHAPVPAGVDTLFTWALETLIRESLQPEGGDPSFQALVLRAREPVVDEYVRLSAQVLTDARAVRAAVNAVAHPGKLRHQAPAEVQEALAPLHRHAMAGEWSALRPALEPLLAQAPTDDAEPRALLEALSDLPALQRLERGAALLRDEAVQRYRALCERRGPLAGTASAAANGRAAARLGAAAEAGTVQAFNQVAALLDREAPGGGRHSVVHGLRIPGHYPGVAAQTKGEWDVALVRAVEASDTVDIVLLAEVKASAAAATTDLPRLLRGLERLAQAQPDASYTLAANRGEVKVSGGSLRALQPRDETLPPQVIYCCAAPTETPPAMLSAATKAVLLTDAACVAFARSLVEGGSLDAATLLPLWADLLNRPLRWRSVLRQYPNACHAREAMLQPQDLVSALVAAMAA